MQLRTSVTSIQLSHLFMPRTHKRKLAAKYYRNHNDDKNEQALTAVAKGKLSIKQASKKFKIAYGTLSNKFHGRHCLKPGGKPVFSTEEKKLSKTLKVL
ncbi:hypothetical protein RN001_013998 [Aquatica leii]|uniref:HTH psq-type domain-containing protein n=1 Tax=Aquatica leii TaxID=1421715 RepID=A0AAN7QDL3_9COLE|nr:hypothetical protein RN001_013998 [Aquatica leii]